MTTPIMLLSLTVSIQALLPATILAQSPHARDSAAVVGAISHFHDALALADTAAALGLLTFDVVVLEAGTLETLDQYRAHHLPADIEFARAIASQRTVRQVRVVGDAAWVAATSEARGTFRERAIDSEGAELMVLRRTEKGWRIAAVHWSSHVRRRRLRKMLV